ncbi:unnamed protein product [Acanthoscelides obtectus]|uniref:Uncharacterized protein n=1 Tax=Acanthoscelides obtectus TaxID=200917 RepID=A0A9P0LXG6_ACAOB|nr:unnamed protein product [Acanthoscelides obtectus]CAK1655868.1 hypothetical protein AOBTE_LOCUS19402 [Acanthoscelides obtectus]
MKGTLLVNF